MGLHEDPFRRQAFMDLGHDEPGRWWRTPPPPGAAGLYVSHTVPFEIFQYLLRG